MDKKQYAQLVAKAWSDPTFVQKLYNNPKAALSEVGVQVSGTATAAIIITLKNGETVAIPPKQKNVEPYDPTKGQVCTLYCCH